MLHDKQTILIVDDEPQNIMVLSSILKQSYKIKASTSGEQALNIASDSEDLDLILLDVMMPNMNGYEVCKKLKSDQRTSRIPIIFVTGRTSSEDEKKGLELGAIDYLAKPICPTLVLQRIKTHLSLIDQNRALEFRVVQRTEELEESRKEIIHCLGKAAEYKDNETGKHVLRMSYYSEIIAQNIGLDEATSKTILYASPMHDLGKIGIPDAILLKNGKLNDSEWNMMRQHPQFGYDILSDSHSGVLDMAKIIALGHHEKWNGTGYPQKLKGEEIPLEARIVAIADVFDALTSARPYKEAWTNERAFDLIEKDAGSHFDPDLVPVFLAHEEEVLRYKAMYADHDFEDSRLSRVEETKVEA